MAMTSPLRKPILCSADASRAELSSSSPWVSVRPDAAMITAGRSGADAAWVPGNMRLDEQVVATVVLESLDIARIKLLAERSQLEQARHVTFDLDLLLGHGQRQVDL